MTRTNQFLCICFIAVCCIYRTLSLREGRWCKEVVAWELKDASTYFNATGILRRGDGKEIKVETEIIKNGKVNVTQYIDVCCDGFQLHVSNNGKREKCKKCPYLTYGKNCSGTCNCDGFKKCDHVTGECKRCIEKPCKDEDQDIIEHTTSKEITSVIYTSPSTPLTTDGHIHTTTSTKGQTTDDIPIDIGCEICVAANNCTDQQNCFGLTANRGDEDKNESDDNTILIAVILSLAFCTIVLVAGIVARERYHRERKRKHAQQYLDDGPCKSGDAEYVDPEPLYFEIKDEDITSNGKICHQTDINNPTFDNEYQLSIHQRPLLPNGRSSAYNKKDPSETEEHLLEKTDGIKEDENGYMSPYTPLRFARSESNLFRDKQDKESGKYDVVYSIEKRSDGETTSKNGDEKDISTPVENKEERNSTGENKDEINNGRQSADAESSHYFVLEKTQRTSEDVESHDQKHSNGLELVDNPDSPSNDFERYKDHEREQLLPKQTSV